MSRLSVVLRVLDVASSALGVALTAISVRDRLKPTPPVGCTCCCHRPNSDQEKLNHGEQT